MKKKILITGINGLIGSDLSSFLRKADIKYDAPDRKELDLKNLLGIKEFLDQKKPEIIVHLAAETNVDLCEIQKTHALLVNYESTKVIADYCSEQNARLIYVSTSGALAGNNVYQSSEIDITNPVNFYSLTKVRSEEYIQRTVKNYLIVRAAWMIGITNGENKKFAEKIYKQIVSGAPQVKAVNNLYGSLTFGKRLAQFILDNIDIFSNDIVHCASNTVCSRFDIAKHIKFYTKSPTEIIPVASHEFPLSAPRGFSEGLSSEIAQYKFHYNSFSWEEELNCFLEDVHG
jgi:dTDP-4-dehydrorhamnose reductase